jgi:hypothetical protein
MQWRDAPDAHKAASNVPVVNPPVAELADPEIFTNAAPQPYAAGQPMFAHQQQPRAAFNPFALLGAMQGMQQQQQQQQQHQQQHQQSQFNFFGGNAASAQQAHMVGNAMSNMSYAQQRKAEREQNANDPNKKAGFMDRIKGSAYVSNIQTVRDMAMGPDQEFELPTLKWWILHEHSVLGIYYVREGDRFTRKYRTYAFLSILIWNFFWSAIFGSSFDVDSDNTPTSAKVGVQFSVGLACFLYTKMLGIMWKVASNPNSLCGAMMKKQAMAWSFAGAFQVLISVIIMATTGTDFGAVMLTWLIGQLWSWALEFIQLPLKWKWEKRKQDKKEAKEALLGGESVPEHNSDGNHHYVAMQDDEAENDVL